MARAPERRRSISESSASSPRWRRRHGAGFGDDDAASLCSSLYGGDDEEVIITDERELLVRNNFFKSTEEEIGRRAVRQAPLLPTTRGWPLLVYLLGVVSPQSKKSTAPRGSHRNDAAGSDSLPPQHQTLTAALGAAERARRKAQRHSHMSPSPIAVLTGRFFFFLTTILALAYGSLRAVVTVADVVSSQTKATVFSGSLDLVLSAVWCATGPYAHSHARRALSNRSLAATIRLHSKTVFKIPAAALLALVSGGVVCVTNYGLYAPLWGSFEDGQTECARSWHLDETMCRCLYIFQCIYSVFVFSWNMLVGVILLSVCRSHTIGVRRFRVDLQNDGKVCELYRRKKLKTQEFSTSLQLDDLYLPEHHYDHSERGHDPTPMISRLSTIRESTEDTDSIGEGVDLEADGVGRPMSPSSLDGMGRSADLIPLSSKKLTTEDIMFCYWKLMTRLRSTSRFMQRWLMTWLSFLILWLILLMVRWLRNSATVVEIIQFILPVVAVIIIAVAYAEVNSETKLVVSTICPLPDRLDLIRTLNGTPLYMTVFNYPLDHSTIATVMAAIGLAFVSRVILDEFLG